MGYGANLRPPGSSERCPAKEGVERSGNERLFGFFVGDIKS